MSFFTVDRILTVFEWLIKVLRDLEGKHSETAQNIQEQIDKLSAEKKIALDAANHAATVAGNFAALVNK